MQTEILAKVAEYIRNPEVRQRVGQAVVSSPPTDAVTLSAEALQKQSDSSQITNQWERDHQDKVSVVEAQVHGGNYKLSPEMIDKIATAIVDLL